MLAQRLGDERQLDEKHIDFIIDCKKKYPHSVDEVWFATNYGYPKTETHAETAKKCVLMAKKLRENGIKVSLQVSNTVGHGQYMAAQDCSGLVFENTPARKMVGHDGSVADYCFCWRDSYAKQYILDSILPYMALKPETVWIDDDFRFRNHAPVQFGCYCKQCIEDFNAQNGYTFTREALVSKMLTDIKIRKQYFDFLYEGMYNLMFDIASLVHKTCPDASIGLQNGLHGGYVTTGYNFAFDAIKKATGKPAKFRAGGGAYDDHNPNEMLHKGYMVCAQQAYAQHDMTCMCPEIENLPFVVFGKSPRGTVFETCHYFACGATHMSYSMMMYTPEQNEWYAEFFKLFSENAHYFNKMTDINKNSYPAGIRYYMPEHGELKQGAKDFNEIKDNNPFGAELLLRDGVPITFDKRENSVFFLHGNTVDSLSEQEIDCLLCQNVICDGLAIEKLQKRGYSFALTVKAFTEHDAIRVTENFTDHKVNAVYNKQNTVSFFAPGESKGYFIQSNCTSNEILGTYNNGEVATLITNTKNGAKWAVMGYMPWKGVINASALERLLNIADYITKSPLPARIASPAPAVLLPRCDKNNKTVSVSITNCTITEMFNLKLLIRNPKSEDFRFMTEGEQEIPLQFKKISDTEYEVTVPALKAWTVGTIYTQ